MAKASKKRLCKECGLHIMPNTAVRTNFGMFHEHCYSSDFEFTEKHAPGLTWFDIGLERVIYIPRISKAVRDGS